MVLLFLAIHIQYSLLGVLRLSPAHLVPASPAVPSSQAQPRCPGLPRGFFAQPEETFLAEGAKLYTVVPTTL